MPLAFLLVLVMAVSSPVRVAPPPKAGDTTLESVVAVRSLRGFQGLFEWQPGETRGVPEKLLGGPWLANGALVDVRGIARDLGIPLALSVADGEAYVLTTLRNVHGATDIRVRGLSHAEGPIPAAFEGASVVVAEDPALDLALLRVARPLSDGRFPKGLRLDPTPIVHGREVDRLEQWGWSLHRHRDQLWYRGEIGFFDSPFWLSALPVWMVRDPIHQNHGGGPLVDPGSGRLVGLLANGMRQTRNPDGWSGAVFAIPADFVADFLGQALRGAVPVHGSLADGGPETLRVDPDLAALHGLDQVRGQLVLDDWPQGEPLLRHGDIVLAAGGRKIGAGGWTLGQLAFEAPRDRALPLEVLRDGSALRVAAPIVPLRRPTFRDVEWWRFAGAWFQDVSPELSQRGYDEEGAVVVHVEPGSPAEAAELDFRLVVHRVVSRGESVGVKSAGELRDAIDAFSKDESFSGEIGLLLTDLRHPDESAVLRVLRMDPDRLRSEVAP